MGVNLGLVKEPETEPSKYPQLPGATPFPRDRKMFLQNEWFPSQAFFNVLQAVILLHGCKLTVSQPPAPQACVVFGYVSLPIDIRYLLGAPGLLDLTGPYGDLQDIESIM